MTALTVLVIAVHQSPVVRVHASRSQTGIWPGNETDHSCVDHVRAPTDGRSRRDLGERLVAWISESVRVQERPPTSLSWDGNKGATSL